MMQIPKLLLALLALAFALMQPGCGGTYECRVLCEATTEAGQARYRRSGHCLPDERVVRWEWMCSK